MATTLFHPIAFTYYGQRDQLVEQANTQSRRVSWCRINRARQNAEKTLRCGRPRSAEKYERLCIGDPVGEMPSWLLPDHGRVIMCPSYSPASRFPSLLQHLAIHLPSTRHDCAISTSFSHVRIWTILRPPKWVSRSRLWT